MSDQFEKAKILLKKQDYREAEKVLKKFLQRVQDFIVP